MDGMDAGQCSCLLSLSPDIHLSTYCCNICAMSEIILKKAFDQNTSSIASIKYALGYPSHRPRQTDEGISRALSGALSREMCCP